MKLLLTLAALLVSAYLSAQNFYSGYIDDQELTLVLEEGYPNDGTIGIYYLGDDQHYPFWLFGYIDEGTLKLTEYQGDVIMSELLLPAFDANAEELNGEMTFMGSGEAFKFSLEKMLDLSSEEYAVEGQRLDQLAATSNRNFALLVSKDADEYYARTTGLIVMDEDYLITQEFEGLDGMAILGFQSVKVDDYNFDGLQDVAVFGNQYAGSNTSSFYFLYNRETQEFEFNESLSSLLSATFDWSNKIVVETKQSGQEFTQTYYSYDSNGNLLQLNMTEEEYEVCGDTWDLISTQEGDFETQIDQGKVVFFYDGRIFFSFGGMEFNYTVQYDENRVTLTNVAMPEDIITYTIELPQENKQIWTRLENDNFETLVLTR